MRKILISALLLMALITLSACSQTAVPAATESPTPVESDISLPTPTTTPEPTPSPTPVVLPDYYPPTDFEVASVWKAEPFGDEGGALLYMSDIVDGAVSFKLYMYQYICEQYPVDRRMNLSTTMATANYDGEKYLFSADQGDSGAVGVDSLIKLDGTLSLSEETLVLKYNDAELPDTYQGTSEFGLCESAPNIRYEDGEWSYGNYTTFLPVTFTRVPEGEAGKAMYNMPMYEDEISLPVQPVTTLAEIENIMGKPDEIVKESESSLAMSYIYNSCTLNLMELWNTQSILVSSFTSSDLEHIPDARGAKIGDDIRKVIASFLCEPESYEDILDSAPENGEIALYGLMQNASRFCRLEFENGKPIKLWYVPGGEWVIYTFDEYGYVESIQYCQDI